jgi:predicted DNA-binding protein
MHVSVRLKSDVELQLIHLVEITGKPKSALINEAILNYANSMNLRGMQSDINKKMQAMNKTDADDETSDLGDYA